jgi:hypothetical protein
VFPDTPFYAVGMPEYRRLQHRSGALHGSNGENPYRVLAHAVDRRPLSDGALAFVLGILAHMITDAAFHPVVYYFCGWPDHPETSVATGATARHFRFEAYLDQWYMRRRTPTNRGCYGVSLRAACTSEDGDTGLEEAAEALLFGTTGPNRPALRQCLAQHAIIQGTFPLPPVALALQAASLFVPRAGTYAALYYRGFRRFEPAFFQRPLAYRHPVTGECRSHSIPDLADGVCLEAAELFSALFSAFEHGRFASDLAAREGRSLETGLPTGDRRPMRFTDTRLLPLGR